MSVYFRSSGAQENLGGEPWLVEVSRGKEKKKSFQTTTPHNVDFLRCASDLRRAIATLLRIWAQVQHFFRTIQDQTSPISHYHLVFHTYLQKCERIGIIEYRMANSRNPAVHKLYDPSLAGEHKLLILAR